MKKIKNLGTRIINGRKESWGLFLCPTCNFTVEKFLGNGGKCKSCGCNFIKHGEGHGTRLYNTWAAMKQRCLNPKNKSYLDYGGRGITICNEWLEFIPFRDWALNNGYKDTLQINRINNNSNYEPSNCNFVTSTENCRNQRNNKLNLEIANEIRRLNKIDVYTRKELSIKYNTSRQNIDNIINNKIWKNK